MNGIRISQATLRSPFGSDYASLWNALTSGACVYSDAGAAAKDPEPHELGIDRRALRTTDKQARLLLAAAIECADGLDDQARTQCGMYLGLPTVDEPMPQLGAVADWHEDRGRTPLVDHFKRHSAPLGWLGMLNSSAAAHVAARLRISGCNGVYSPFADAGLNALFDAAIAVAADECAQALVGAVAPKHDPMLRIQHANWCAPEHLLPPTEASACALVSRCEAPNGARLLGFARGFAPMPWHEDTVSEVVARALEMANCTPSQVGWTLSTAAWNPAQAAALQTTLAAFAGHGAALALEAALGRSGPAAPLIALGLALHGLERGEVLHENAHGAIVPRAIGLRNLLIVAVSPLGQCAAVVIGGEP